MHLPNQVKPVSRVSSPESHGAYKAGALRESDWLDDILKGVDVGTNIVGKIGQTILPFLSFL